MMFLLRWFFGLTTDSTRPIGQFVNSRSNSISSQFNRFDSPSTRSFNLLDPFSQLVFVELGDRALSPSILLSLISWVELGIGGGVELNFFTRPNQISVQTNPDQHYHILVYYIILLLHLISFSICPAWVCATVVSQCWPV